MLKFSTEYYRTIAKDTNAEKTVAELCDEIDRLRGEQQTPPQGKEMARVSIKVAVDRGGSVAVGEDQFQYLLEPRAYYTLTAPCRSLPRWKWWRESPMTDQDLMALRNLVLIICYCYMIVVYIKENI